jgi:hypothetical protein
MFMMFSSCSTDLEINADYKEIPVVFCVLNPSREMQYVKINKTFLGKIDAHQMAQQSDSLFFTDNIVVILKKYTNKNEVASWIFDRCDSIPKDDGLFANDKNIIYQKKIDFGVNTKDDEYKIIVNIGEGKHIVEGNTKLIFGSALSKPNESNHLSLTNYKNNYTIEYYAGWATNFAEIYLQFNYFEVTGSDTVYKSFKTRFLKEVVPSNYDNLRPLTRSFSIMDFYSLLMDLQPVPFGTKRYVKMPDSFVFEIVTANNEYYTYTQVTKPSEGIIQFRPNYTNLEGGLGLFAATNYYNIRLKMSRQNLDTLHRGIYTRNLGFVDKDDLYYFPFF